MVIVIDNYDSFTYNLVQRLGEIDPSVQLRVFRNDEVSVDDLDALSPDRILISPGPCTPNEAGISVDCVRHFAGKIPLLGVCLGHQSIGQAFGATIIRAPQLMHGKTDEIFHDDGGLFHGLAQPFIATRYHSLVIAPETVPDCLQVGAWTDTGGTRQIMCVRHKTYPIEGWQFHPESFLTEPGIDMLTRFLKW
ncbi:anthranilate synthase component II [Roseiconus lacunae]|uniref:Aminodeoxychorismate/anthranilate synthase component II n=1 Tax=Roseiconus lacunae TaxID=2605694 RepID=A0ABT7PJG7_9BACT|nr:aminodeoxychorismate/anthranilate synthase component II [Roseiconus lacunae]MCD0461706.1 aminodeoxychorismate/anthranilate synthase component II [Roseiconus lacunae]MDM4016647.1 aminodeoxychorismate/anthranilate synthase component II [Roseiconus lacunae]WRQ49515.1 aminodeoxychorismate/anthranilate synthase component II [Stieleria sp. HD01]